MNYHLASLLLVALVLALLVPITLDRRARWKKRIGALLDETSIIERYDTVSATFQPKRTDDLRPEAVPYIRKRLNWLASWIADDGPYEGQMVFTPTDHRTRIGWVPRCDLTGITLIDRIQPRPKQK